MKTKSDWITFSDRHYGPTSPPSIWLRELPDNWELPSEDRMVWILWAISAGVVPRTQPTLTELGDRIAEIFH